MGAELRFKLERLVSDEKVMEAKGSCSLSEGSESGAGNKWLGVDGRGTNKNWILGSGEKWGSQR